MKIAYLNAYGNGSTGKIVDSLRRVCQQNGIETISIFSREHSSSTMPTIKCFNKAEFYLDAICTRMFDNHGLNSKNNTKKIIKILKEFKPDIIHIHNLHGYWINYEKLFKFIRYNDIKVVWTFHDCWAFTGHCVHFDYISCDKWKEGCCRCGQLKEYPASLLLDGSKKNYKKKKKYFTSLNSDSMVVVTPSEWLGDKVRDSFFNKYDIKVINNGVDLQKFRYTVSDKRDNIINKGYERIILGVAGDWNDRKGLKYIIDAANLRKNWTFVVIGRIDNNKKQNSNGNILYIDKTENVEDLAKWYSAADVFVNPTLEDTYPTTNLEAIACHTPVVTFPTGGSGEIIKKTGFGIITTGRTCESLIEGIERVFEKNIICNGYTEYIDAERKFYEYIDVYKKIIY